MGISDELRDAIRDYTIFIANLPKMTRNEIDFEMRTLQHRLCQDAPDEDYETMQLLKKLVDEYGGKAKFALGVPSDDVFAWQPDHVAF